MSTSLPSAEGLLSLSINDSLAGQGNKDLTQLSQQIDSLNEQAWDLRSLDSKRASQLAEQALNLARSIHYQAGQADALLARGFASFRLAQVEAAREDAEQARLIFEQLQDKQKTLKALNLLGIIHGQTGNLEKALETFLSNRKLLHELGDTQGEANAINNAAFAYTLLGDYLNALEFYLSALKLFEVVSNREGMVRALMNIGSTYLELEDFKEALPYFSRSLELAGVEREPQVHANTLISMGRCHEALGDIEKAFGYILEGLRIAESVEDRSGIATALDKLGFLYAQRGDVVQAKNSYSHALLIKKETGDRPSQAYTMLLMGDLFFKQKEFASALDILQTALALATEIGNKLDIAETHQRLSQVQEALGSFEAALYHVRNAVKFKNEIFNESSNRRLQSLRVTFQIEQAEKEREIYRLKNVALAQANEQLHNANEEKSHLLEQLARQAQEDALTGLYNRRYFDARMELEFHHAQTLGVPLSVMMCDIDNFKSINDTYSHQMGDTVLTKVAELFRKGLRETDVLARYGGEEFILLMPTATMDHAVKLCERLRYSIETYAWHELHPNLKVTLSLGVANDASCSNHEKLIGQADAKLYQAKRSGKNKVCW
jgi:diguanylate cyclase (GGDEF)-like protein